MKAADFSAQLKQAGIELWKKGAKEPQVVVMVDGVVSLPVNKVTSRIHESGPQIVLHIGEE